MPHLTLEYTSNLPRAVAGPELFGRLHGILADVGGIEMRNCKSRALGYDTFLVGDGGDEVAYVHLDVRILEGRAADVRREVGRQILETLRAAYDADTRSMQVTVEIRDMSRELYFK
jgi:5-carboxymethyl-2-hydroxymuconate isomerase